LVAAAQEECYRARIEKRTPKISGVARVLDELLKELDPRERDTFQAIRSLQRRLNLLALYLEPNGIPITPYDMEAGTSETGWGDLRVIDLSMIHDEDVKAIVAELILRKIAHYIESGKRSMAPSPQKWFIIVDEAWRLLKPSEDGRYRTKLEWLYRVGRNWNVGLVALTQLWSDIGKIASNADLQVHLSIADAETVAELVEYTGLQKLRQLGPQLPKHAALILNRSTTDDLERLAAATLYQGRAKIWVVAEMFRLYLPNWQVKLVQREIVEEREAINVRLKELSAQILTGRMRFPKSDNLTGGAQEESAQGISRASDAEDTVPASDDVGEQEPVPGYDPLAELISKLRAKYPGNYKREEVLAACILITNGVLRDGKLDLGSVNVTVKRWLERLGVYDPKIGLPKPTFEKLVRRLAGLQLHSQLDGVVKLTCHKCFTYPITPSHICPSNGGGLREQ
jgi:hypothetical protein